MNEYAFFDDIWVHNKAQEYINDKYKLGFFSDSLDDVCALCGQENDDDVSLVDVVWVCRIFNEILPINQMQLCLCSRVSHLNVFYFL